MTRIRAQLRSQKEGQGHDGPDGDLIFELVQKRSRQNVSPPAGETSGPLHGLHRRDSGFLTCDCGLSDTRSLWRTYRSFRVHIASDCPPSPAFCCSAFPSINPASTPPRRKQQWQSPEMNDIDEIDLYGSYLAPAVVFFANGNVRGPWDPERCYQS
jgi:hypothetical protein